MYKIRFHLGAGPFKGHWQIKDAAGNVRYACPELFELWMQHCRLRNRPAKARKIHAGEKKDVCAWIECENVLVKNSWSLPAATGTPISYNPRVAPHWLCAGEPGDNSQWTLIRSQGRELQGMQGGM